MRRRFDARLLTESGGRRIVYVLVPFDAAKAFGVRGGIPVVGTIGGHPFRSHLYARRDAPYVLLLNASLRRTTGLEAGMTVTIELDVDRAPRPIEPPPALARALRANSAARAAWRKLGRRERKDLVRRLEVKTPAAMARKVAQAIAILVQSPRR